MLCTFLAAQNSILETCEYHLDEFVPICDKIFGSEGVLAIVCVHLFVFVGLLFGHHHRHWIVLGTIGGYLYSIFFVVHADPLNVSLGHDTLWASLSVYDKVHI